MESKDKILVMYSGGLDSLGTVWTILTNPLYKRYALHVHHVHNHNVENRAKAEAIAVDLALNEIKRLGYNFEYTESEMRSPHIGTGFLYDTDTMNFFAGFICSNDRRIKKVAMGMTANDANQRLEERRVRANKIFSAFTDAEKIYPVMTVTKQDIYRMLPESLRNLFWSCRTPQYRETQILPCGHCHSCRELIAQGIRSLDNPR